MKNKAGLIMVLLLWVAITALYMTQEANRNWWTLLAFIISGVITFGFPYLCGYYDGKKNG